MRVANKLCGMISLAQKAGKIVSGETAVRAAIQKGQAVMLLAEEGASANTKDTMNKLATAYALPLLYVEDVGAAIGKPGRTMLALCDAGFAAAINKINDESKYGGVEVE